MSNARYHQQTYGSPLVYGTGGASGLLAWGIEIDWNNDGVFDGTNEAFRMIAFESFRGRKKLLKKAGSGFEIITPAKFAITLKNGDGRYDDMNTASPLYPYIQNGVDVKITVVYQATGIQHKVIYGIVDDITPSYSSARTVKITCTDTTAYLTKNTARVAVSANVRPETAIGSVLDYMNWPTRWGRSIDVSSDLISFYWANGNKQALTEIQDLSQSFFGYFFADNEGRARFIKRTASGASVVDFTQDQLLKDLGNAALYDNYRNVTRMKIHPRLLSTLTTIYQLLGNKPIIHPGTINKEEIWGNYSYNNSPSPASNVVAPVANTDYTFNSLEDGTGVDYTASVTVSFSDFGDTCKFIITSSAAVDVYCTKLQVRGQALYEQNTSDVTYPTDVSSVTNQRELKIDLLWLQDINVARDLANIIGYFVSTKNPTPVIVVESRPDIQFTPDLFDIITLTAAKIGINGSSFRISGIEHKTLIDTCQAVRTIFYLEPYISGNSFWTWPILDFGTDTIFGW